MQRQTRFASVALTLAIMLVSASSGLAQAVTCTDCHNDTTVITGKRFAWAESTHATGEAAAYAGGRASCTACHSGASFSAMVAAGQNPSEVKAVTDVTRQDCRACHQIHTTYTSADWALETTAPVKLIAFQDLTYDGGKGNLCANCHQPRRQIDEVDADGNIAVTSTHWGPHHGPQSAMLLGQGGAGLSGTPSFHAKFVADTCVTCHIGPNYSHTFEPVMTVCSECHAEDFNVAAAQAEVEALVTQLGDLLKVKGLLDEAGHPVVGKYPAAQAEALWNYIFIAIEDGSLGVHNNAYTKALLEAGIAALQ